MINKIERTVQKDICTLFIYIIKREQERETPEDLKQAFRVFDKVSIFSKPITYDNAIQALFLIKYSRFQIFLCSDNIEI